MKKFLSALLALVFTVSLAAAASRLPGPPEQFKDWPQIGEKWAACPDSRLLQIKFYAKDANFEIPGAASYSDVQGTFLWIYYTDKNEESDARWYVAFDGEAFWMFSTMDEIAARWASPCYIPRPLKEQKL